MTDRRKNWVSPPLGDERRKTARRRAPRIDVNIPVECSNQEFGLHFRAANLSSGGMYLRGQFPLHEGSVALLEFLLPQSGALIRCGGEVRRVDLGRKPGMHVEFFELQERDRTRLESFVDDVLQPEDLPLDIF